MYINIKQAKPGTIIKYNGQLYSIFSSVHRTPGNLPAFVQVKMRNLDTGAMIENRFASDDRVERVVLDEQQMEYLYQDGGIYYFMNTENYEQVGFNQDDLGDNVPYLIPNLGVSVQFYNGKPLNIQLPAAVVLTVVETEPGLKSATVSNVTKPAKLETGLVVQVPPFINEGEKIRVNTLDGSYLERA